MKRLLFLLFLISCSSLYSQNLIQTYVDRCTGEVKVMSVPMNGSTVVAYYNRSRVFTASDFQNGTLQSWLEETYLWWSSLNPCSTNQTQQTTVQTTVQQTTQQATQAATQAATTPVVVPQVTAKTPTVNVSPPPTSPAPTQSAPQTTSAPVDTASTNTTAPTTDSGSSASTTEPPPQTDSTGGPTETSNGETSTAETTTEQATTETSESQTETQQTESSSDDSGGNESSNNETESTSETQDEGGSDSETTTEDSTEETSSESESEETVEESTEESSEESSDESSEEETTEEESTEEESSEEESSEEESESEDEESSDESSSEDEEEEEDSKKKTFAPPIISANVASMQNIDGTFNQTMTIGVSRSSLLGTETYAVNAMVWDNLQQFMLNGSYSRVHINDEGRVNRVYSASIGGARMFTTTMANIGQSLTYLGKKGSVKGLALSSSMISVEFDFSKGKISQDAVLFAPALTGFWTKTFPYSDRLNISPMLAVSSPFMLHDWFNQTTTWNSDIMAIVGSNFDLMLTKRFKLNIGVNTINNTNPDIRMTWNFTIGSRFSF